MRKPTSRRAKLAVILTALVAVAAVASPAQAGKPKLTPEQKVYAHAEEECTDHKAEFRTFAANSPALFTCYRTKTPLDKDDLEDLMYDCFQAASFRGSTGSFGGIRDAKGRVTGLECVLYF